LFNFFKIENANSRVFGLDLLRFFAIFFVLLGHSKIFMPDNRKGFVNSILLDGVAIFFVLSGFLIGGILIKILENKKANFQNLLHFWKRRWLRTVPAYFTVLTVVVLFTWFFKPDKLNDQFYLYYVFMQNMWTPQPSFYSEAWSLSIEEWFYLLIPSFLFLGIAVSKWKPKYWLIIVIVLVVCLSIANRAYIFHHAVFTSPWDAYSKAMARIFTRLDALMCGVLGAFLAAYFPKIWNFAKIPLMLIGIYSIFWLKHHGGRYDSSFNIIWVPTLKSLATLCFLPFLSQLKVGFGQVGKFITTVSVISYSMYLLNLNVVVNIIIKFFFHGTLNGQYVKTDFWIWDFTAYWLLTFVLSFLVYKWVEIPFIHMRDKKIAVEK
jgi:peptidoglycan/LPS O-acetylase OafA/YrhL